MAKRIGKYKVSKKDRALSAADAGSEFSGDWTGITGVSSTTLTTTTTTGNLEVGTNIKGGTNAADNTFLQYEGTEVARIHDGGVEPTHTGTSTSFTAHTGFGWRRRVITLGSGNDDTILALSLADSGCIIYVTPFAACTIKLPTIGTETGFWCTVVMADAIAKNLIIQTTVQDGNDNIFLLHTSTEAENVTPFTFDVGGGHDQLTANTMLEGTKIELTNVAGGAAEVWLANVISTDGTEATIA